MLLYDADCGFCTRAAGFAARLGLTAHTAPLQQADLAALGVDPERALVEVPFVDRDGRVVYGAKAIAATLGTGNTFWRAVSRALDSWPVRRLAAVVYRVVARNRHRLPGGTVACELPTAPTAPRPGYRASGL